MAEVLPLHLPHEVPFRGGQGVYLAALVLHTFLQRNGLHPFGASVIPLAEEVLADIGVPLLEVLVAGHFHHFQH